MSAVYEAIGRLVVALVSRRYRQELRLAGIAAIVLALIAILLRLQNAGGSSPGLTDRTRQRAGSRRKRRSGSFVSIR